MSTHAPPREAKAASATVDAARSGDRDAFAEIYRCYRNPVFCLIYSRVRDKDLADDLTSETFARALRSIGTYTHQGRDIGAWLVTIAKNLMLDHFKLHRNRFEFAVEDTGDDPDDSPGPEAAVLLAGQRVAVREAIGRLNNYQGACMRARYVDGLTLAQTAARIGGDVNTVKGLTLRALANMRRDADLVAWAGAL
jgi:RNA polymerase sigma-70 factor (ECF subfamily)